jgi:predicted peroxiredoxin
MQQGIRIVMLIALLVLGVVLFIVFQQRFAASPSTTATPAQHQSPAKAPSFVVNLTRGEDDLHAVWMGLRLVEHALDDGRDVTVFMNVHAAPLARKDLSLDVRFEDTEPIREMLARLQQRGARILVCPSCMELTDVTEDDLLDGAAVASRESLFGKLGPDATVFSY